MHKKNPNLHAVTVSFFVCFRTFSAFFLYILWFVMRGVVTIYLGTEIWVKLNHELSITLNFKILL